MNTIPVVSLSSSDADSQPPPSTGATSSGKRQRGRPPGSKNKPKNIPTNEANHADHQPTKLVLIDVPQGEDAIESVVELALREKVSVTLLGGTGSVWSVTLRHEPRGTTGFTLHGPFSLVSFTGTYVYSNDYTLNPGASPPPRMAFSINLSTSEGQTFGGNVGGKVIAGEDHVSLTVSLFKNPEVYRFRPEESNHNDNVNGAGDLGWGGNLSGSNVVAVWGNVFEQIA
ncbi:hypothetical protein Fmac_026763 [Flemingia macrophylla]|uniref:PPC domain-containing protein n=1 Tax=Flemingia macrophylla TaxID=520843 RepID=A0ABD1LFS3_9FABA